MAGNAALRSPSRSGYTVLGERSRVALALLYCLFSAQVTAMLGFHEAIGAVLAAYVFHDLFSMEHAWRRWVGRFGHLFLTPIFFACSGIQVSLGAFSDPTLWLWLLLFLVGGIVGKVLGSYVGARLSGLTPKVSLELGVLMNTKGLVELVVLGVGLQMGVLSESSYSVLLMLALVSTALTNPLISLLNRSARKSDAGYNVSPHTGV
ncbi:MULTISPECIES: cation:proton antiporter [unclassified Pseudomonas]|uniref:cation:proton antiporter n=1 Tax=unclassified Pseudomonas TaxID=196821 RepID=UPI0035C0F685